MMKRLEHANLCVHDVDAVTRFLMTAFPDFRIRKDTTEADGSRWVHVGNAETYIALNQAKPQEAKRGTPYKGRPGLNHLGYEVDDVGAIQRRLRAAGYQDSTLSNDHPHRKRIYFYDPDGNDWEFVRSAASQLARRRDVRCRRSLSLHNHADRHTQICRPPASSLGGTRISRFTPVRRQGDVHA